MEKFQNKYRIPSARLPHWDYGHNAAYFITICTHNMEHFFGEIKNDEMHLYALGKFAAEFWLEIPTKFPFAKLDAFVIMPNHMHGVLIINKEEMPYAKKPAPARVETRLIASPTTTTPETRLIASLPASVTPPPATPPSAPVQTRLIASIQGEAPAQSHENGGIAGLKNPMLQENISRMMRWYKGRCTFEIHKTHSRFAWQSRFHDHVIRDEKALERIRNYIVNNPYNWKKDKFHS